MGIGPMGAGPRWPPPPPRCFCYRKASMDDIAAAAGLSRQALYLRFDSKDELFRAAVGHVLEESLLNARALLNDSGELRSRIVRAYAALHGAHLGDAAATQNMLELTEAAAKLIGPHVHQALDPFVDDVTRALVTAKVAGARDNPSARDLAATIDAASRGLKHSVASLSDYEREMARVVRVICRAVHTGSKR